MVRQAQSLERPVLQRHYKVPKKVLKDRRRV
jgi:hypothetical protein